MCESPETPQKTGYFAPFTQWSYVELQGVLYRVRDRLFLQARTGFAVNEVQGMSRGYKVAGTYVHIDGLIGRKYACRSGGNRGRAAYREDGVGGINRRQLGIGN